MPHAYEAEICDSAQPAEGEELACQVHVSGTKHRMSCHCWRKGLLSLKAQKATQVLHETLWIAEDGASMDCSASAKVKLVEPKVIARSQGKAVRVIDNRKI